MAEVIDFLRFNVSYMQQIYEQQPPKNSHGVWNRVEYRPLEGYVVAITPFNFTAIGANLPTSPAMMGNVVLWKPASTSVLSNWIFYKVLIEAGLPAGVIQFVPGAGRLIGDTLINHRDFGGLHFTGSTGVFNGIMFKVRSLLIFSECREPQQEPLPQLPSHCRRNWRKGLSLHSRELSLGREHVLVAHSCRTVPSTAPFAVPSSTKARSALPHRESTSLTRFGPSSASAWSPA